MGGWGKMKGGGVDNQVKMAGVRNEKLKNVVASQKFHINKR